MKNFEQWFSENIVSGTCLSTEVIEKIEEYGKYCAEQALKQCDTAPVDEFHYVDWKPEIGDEYYCILITGDIRTRIWGGDDRHDHYRLKTGNVFRTKEEAEYHLRMIDLAHEVKQLSYKPDSDCRCFFIRFSCISARLSVGIEQATISRSTYFKTEAIAEQAIRLFPSDDDFLYCMRKGLV